MKNFKWPTHYNAVLLTSVVFVAALIVSGNSLRQDNVGSIAAREHTVMSVLWFQTAAETRALQYQAYNMARLMLDKDLAEVKTNKKRAVLVDIDETILDNSPYEGRAIQIGKGYPFEWDRWINLAKAEPIPGSLDFLRYAVSRGTDVFYVSNRRESFRKATMENLRRKGFPQVDDSHLYLRTDESSKEPRRQKIAETHHLVVLMGDNLTDFAAVFDRKGVAERNDDVDRLKDEFGKKFIILPNPIYGDWEDAVYDYQTSLPDSIKNLKRKTTLRGF